MPNRITCSRCGNESVRSSRQALNFFARIYCVTFRQAPYRCLACNTRFFGRRRSGSSRQSSGDRPGATQEGAERNGAA